MESPALQACRQKAYVFHLLQRHAIRYRDYIALRVILKAFEEEPTITKVYSSLLALEDSIPNARRLLIESQSLGKLYSILFKDYKKTPQTGRTGRPTRHDQR